jgi:toxin ParE1/3/4
MNVEIRITEAAIRDLEDIHAYCWDNDSPRVANLWLNQTLAGIVERVNRNEERPLPPPPPSSPSEIYPDELFALGIREYREVRIKTQFMANRVIYRLIGDCAYIYLVMDGRQDMQTLLSQRFLMG